MAPDTQAYATLRRNLARARVMLAGTSVCLWLLRALVLCAAAFFLSTLTVLLAGAESVAAKPLGFVAVFGLPVILIAAVMLPLLRLPTLSRVAVMGDGIAPGERNLLIAALQLGGRTERFSSFYSRAIIDALVEEGAALSGSLDFRKVLPGREMRFWVGAAALSVAGLAGFISFAP
ncbi:MAG: hypothetical protein V2A71_02540, partial [Candidatus Eisenbacteria bacterium]